MPARCLTPLLICLVLAPGGCRGPDAADPAPTPPETVRLAEAGTVVAQGSVTVNGPGWGGSQRITWLVPEGTVVAPGDTVIRFDTTEFDQYLAQNSDELDVNRLAVVSARTRAAASRTRTRNAIAKARLADERARLELFNQRYEARTVREGAELARRQAEIGLAQALRDSAAQATLDSLEIAQAELRFVKQQARVARLRTYLDQLTATAPVAGMVVYRREYTEDGIQVFRAGDEVTRRAPVLDITDTSAMRVRFTVHEIDRWRLAVGATATIHLDAYPDIAFAGTVVSIGRLPLATEDGSVARRFEAVADIQSVDPRLKPGMSARVELDPGGPS